jgi:hypothetical protein
MPKHNVPDYVKRGSCSDCLRLWDSRERELLDRIKALEAQLHDAKEERNSALRKSLTLEQRLIQLHPGEGRDDQAKATTVGTGRRTASADR